MKKPLVIVGAGGHSRVVLDVAICNSMDVRGFVDNVMGVGTLLNDVPVIGGDNLFDKQEFVTSHSFIVAIGNQKIRRRIHGMIVNKGGECLTLVHPSAVISPFARVKSGSVFFAGCVVNSNAYIGDFCIVNVSATIDHDVILADGVQVCPGANLAGCVSCGEDVFIGTGAVVIPHVKIGAGATVGAGAVVIRDVLDDDVVVGNPATSKFARPKNRSK